MLTAPKAGYDPLLSDPALLSCAAYVTGVCTIFGPASDVFTRDLGRLARMEESLDYGMAGNNTGLIFTKAALFGGAKQSGLGREGARQRIEDYLETKYVCLAS